ncbi:MAG: transposase, partial [Candidatus Latescibacterota bacterium]
HKVSSPAPHIELWKLPPYSPELNPIEHLWQWVRNNVTHNEFFETLPPPGSGVDSLHER